MSASDDSSLEQDIRALLEAEKELAPPPAGVEGRVFAAVIARVGVPPSGGGGGDGGGGSGASRAHAPEAKLAGESLRRIVSLVTAFVLGGATVATIVALRAPQAEVRIVYVERPAAATASSAASGTSPSSSFGLPVSSLPVSAVPAAKTPIAAPTRPAEALSTGSRLAAERALLDLARAALASGESEPAFAALSRHEREFVHGTLEEEREALNVKALVLAGRAAEARSSATRFRERFPRSTMLRSVESSVDSIPQ